jgi:alkanesulfonate monooxygenase SsuD/methylene tetrahydromethanopterin reductase-like flavin-dependent oxidoreductase (luciferase family)
VIVEQWNGIPFARPLAKVRETVDWLRPVLAGERGEGGFKLAAAPDPPVPIMLAALRDRMLRLAADRGDGAFTNFLPLSGVGQVVEAFGSERELACRFFSVPGPDEEGLPVATRIFAAYATVPVYTEYLRWLGWGEQLEPMVHAWQEGDRARALELAPQQLVREIFLLGPVEAQKERIAEFGAAGIDTAVLALGIPAPRLAEAIDAFAP